MDPRRLILLSPYRYPAANPLVLANEDMASWLNAATALWHPAALWQADGPPRADVPYDHERPGAGCIYALPESPPLFLPDDWEQRVKDAGAVVFKATPSREQTLANLKEAVGRLGATSPDEVPARLWALDGEQVAPFFGLGLGYLLLAALSEAMEHENLLEPDRFWQDVQQAAAALAGVPYVPPAARGASTDEGARDEGLPPNDYQSPPDYVAANDPEARSEESSAEPWRRHLEGAAGQLLAAREVLYPVAIHLLDVALLDTLSPEAAWPASFGLGLPLNLVASASALERLKRDQPERLAALRERVAADAAEVCGGCYEEREDALLPVESQLWNLRRGLDVSRDLLGREITVYARRRFAAHPQLPLFLSSNGLRRALLLALGDAAGPAYHANVVAWSSPDGKQVDAFVRKPRLADSTETWFNLGHALFKTTREDHVATLAFLHAGAAAAPWYSDFLHLGRLASVAGRWTTLSRYFEETSAGEYASPPSADDFHHDYLSERVGEGERESAATPWPVSGFARQQRLRRRMDTCWTLAALERGLAGNNDPLRLEGRLAELEDEIERAGASAPPDGPQSTSLDEVECEVAGALAQRLQVRAAEGQPGYLVLNPCSFIRRVALELDGAGAALPEGEAATARLR
jgi:hypothetical protein